MDDPLRTVRDSEPYRPSAGAHNAFVAAARSIRDLTNKSGAPGRAANRSTGLARVKNNSGADRSRFDVLGIDGVFPDPTDNPAAFKSGPVLLGVTPDADKHVGNFVILLEPLAAGAIGWASVAGVTVAKVDVTDADHQYAEVDDGDAGALDSAPSGSAQILWKQSGTGVKWAVVRLGLAAGSDTWRRYELKTDLTAGGSATAYLLDETGTRTATEFTVHDLLGAISGDGSTEGGASGSDEGTGDKGYCRWMADSEKWEIVFPIEC